MRMLRHIFFAFSSACLAFTPAAMSAATAQTTMPALPKPPYSIKCFQDRDLVVAEDLAAKPVWKDGQWLGRIWSGDPQHPGPEIVVQPGGNGTCIVKQNER